MESINRQSVPQNQKSVSLKPLVEHIYLEDKRQAILQVATNANITISYNPKKHKRFVKRNYRSHKFTRSKSVTSNVPVGKRAVGLRVSMEFFDDTMTVTKLLRGTKEPLYHIAGEDIL